MHAYPVFVSASKFSSQTRMKFQSRIYKCLLTWQGPHEGLAVPISDDDRKFDTSLPKEGIVLRGRTKCGMGFEGDEVVVKLHKDSKGVVISGEVVGIWESPMRPVNQIFFCRVCEYVT